MASKRNCEHKGTSSKSKGKSKATSRDNDSNPYSIIFREELQKSRYDTLIKCKVVNTQYLDDNVLNILGLKNDAYWMLERVGSLHEDQMSLLYSTNFRIP